MINNLTTNFVSSLGNFCVNLWETRETAGDKPEEGEDDVKSACPLYPGRHTCYNGRDNKMQPRESKLTSETRSHVKFSLREKTLVRNEVFNLEHRTETKPSLRRFSEKAFSGFLLRI